MALIRLLRQILALPVLVPASLTSMFAPGIAARLFWLGWIIGRGDESALNMLVMTSRALGPHVALVQAESLASGPLVASAMAFAGLVAIECGQLDGAQRFLDLASQAGPDREGLTEMLQYRLVARTARSSAEIRELANELEARRDLSPTVSKLLLQDQMWLDLTERRLADAHRRALFLLEVDNDPSAELVLWAIHERNGRGDLAEQCLARASNIPRNELLFRKGVAYWAIGQEDLARTTLDELRVGDPALADRADRILDHRTEVTG